MDCICLKPRAFIPVLLLVFLPLLNGCATTYYWQAAMGQWAVSRQSVEIERLLANELLEPALRERLELTQAALTFAHETLLLDSNGSYERYADTGRPYVVWNVFAAPEFSLEPVRWCFPIAGCVAYRGYFKEAAANKYAQRLKEKGRDVHVGGVRAYSTLGKLRDPVLNTMLELSDDAFVALLFHELAHQRLYVKGDTAFNEAFASAVQAAGLERWRAGNNAAGVTPARQDRALYAEALAKAKARVAQARESLQVLYAAEMPDDDRRRQKAVLMQALATDYAALADQAGRSLPYSGLFAKGINNALLAAIASYEDLRPGFMRILAECDGRLPCFYAAVEQLAKASPDARVKALRVTQLSGR